ncbi:MAG: nitrate reductase molybdenum cofactor assembly chaperone [Thermodesulfobacteriota bacterium]
MTGKGMEEGRMFVLFAEILQYPGPDMRDVAKECEALVASRHPQAAALLAEFLATTEGMRRARLEEEYTRVFDMNPDSSPYVGYHLFQDTYKRSLFLIELKKRYREQDFPLDQKELPDHLCLILRFLAKSKDDELNRELIEEAILPSLDQIVKKNEKSAQPAQELGVYRSVLEALRLILQQQPKGTRADGPVGLHQGGSSNV